MRRPFIAGNWKMFKTGSEAVRLATEFREGFEKSPVAAEVLVAPAFTALHDVSRVLAGSPIHLAGQNMHASEEGAFTGEISPLMLRDAGCSHVILGHSERRTLFGETDEGVRAKARSAFGHGLIPVVCVGETLAERDESRTLPVIERQVTSALEGLGPDEVSRLILAYEPVWAIGTGRAAMPAQAQEVHAFARRLLEVGFGREASERTRILYGGSVKPENIAAIMAEADVDGALVGGSCLVPSSFLRIVRFDS